MSQQTVLWIALFIIIYCWGFKVFETKVKAKNYSAAGNLKPQQQKNDFMKATLHINQDKDDNSSIGDVFIRERSTFSNESVRISSSKFPCKLETSNGSEFNSDKPSWDSNLETFSISSSRLESEIDNESNINPTSLSELSRSSEETTGSYINLDQHFLTNNDTINIHSNYTQTERMPNPVNEINRLTAFSNEETLISRASNYNIRTADDILELDMTTGRTDAFKVADSIKIVNDLNNEDKFSDGNTLIKSDLVKSSSIQNQSDSNFNRKKNDGAQALNYIHEMYDAVLGTFVKLKKVHQLVNELKSLIDDIANFQRQLSVEGTTRRSFDETLQGKLELLEASKLNINQGFFEVCKLMSDLAIHLKNYKELHESNSYDARMLKSARVKIFDTMRTINSLMNNVQQDSTKFLKHIPVVETVWIKILDLKTFIELTLK